MTPAPEGRGPAARTALLLAAATLVAACSPTAEPTTGFEQDPGDRRVLELYDQPRAARETVLLPSGSQHARVRMDCIGQDGEIRVEIEEAGSASVPCGQESSPDGFVGLTFGAAVEQDQESVVRVTAPSRARWSVAVDVGPGRLPVGE